MTIKEFLQFMSIFEPCVILGLATTIENGINYWLITTFLFELLELWLFETIKE